MATLSCQLIAFRMPYRLVLFIMFGPLTIKSFIAALLLGGCMLQIRAQTNEAVLQKHLLQQFRIADSLQNSGELKAVDSLIQLTFNTTKHWTDSQLYFKFVQILIDQRKIVSKYDEATILAYQKLAFHERRQENEAVVRTQLQLGEIFRAFANFDQSIKFLDAAEKNYHLFKLQNQLLLASIYGRRAAVFSQLDIELDSVETLSKRVISIAKSEKDADLEAIASNELAFLYHSQGKSEAEPYFKKAISIWTGLNKPLYAINAKFNLARFYLKNDRPAESEVLLGKFKDLMPDTANLPADIKRSYFELKSHYYEKIQDFEQALYFQKKMKEVEILALVNQYNEKYLQLTVELETQKKQLQIDAQQARLENERLVNDKLENEKSRLVVLLGVIAFISILLALLLSLVFKQRLNIKQQSDELIAVNQNLKSSIGEKEALFQELSHRVKNNLNVLSGLVYLQAQNHPSDEVKYELSKIQGRIQSIAIIHDKLYQDNDYKDINFAEYLEEVLIHNLNVYKKPSFQLNYVINCKDLRIPLKQSLPLGMIFNELITNSFKYAFTDKENGSLAINFNPAKNGFTYHDSGTVEIKSKKTGTGLNLIQILANQAEVKIEYHFVANRNEIAIDFEAHATT